MLSSFLPRPTDCPLPPTGRRRHHHHRPTLCCGGQHHEVRRLLRKNYNVDRLTLHLSPLSSLFPLHQTPSHRPLPFSILPFSSPAATLEEMAGIVVVFDFDKTIINLDSDNWVVDELGATDLFNQLLPTMPWNSMMDKLMNELHSRGKTIDDIEQVLKRVPIHPRVVPTIKTAHALGCDLRIVSDANMFYIETILKHIGLRDYFSEIYTNPGFVDEKGKLRIHPFHDFHASSHGCTNPCPPNMCKGRVIERIQSSLLVEGKKKKIIYLGDGAGDFCPSLKLKEGDFMMPRKDFPVWDLICKNREFVKAEIHEWSDGEELERVLIGLIDRISKEEERNNFAAQMFDNCKFQTVPLTMVAQEALPVALPVPH